MPKKGRSYDYNAPEKRYRTGTLSFTPNEIPSVTEGKSPAMDFTAALMHGNPVAERLVEQAIGDLPHEPRKIPLRITTDEEPSWADEFIASTYTYCKGLQMTAHETKIMEPYLAAYREDMRKAHRFVLDNEFTRLATTISSTMQAEKLLAKLQYASLPYETTWIEFDLPTKVHTMRRIHGLDPHIDDLGRKMGVLLHRLSDTEAAVQLIVEAAGMTQLTATMIAYYFSLREHSFNIRDKISGCVPLPMDMDNLLPDKMQAEEARTIGRASLWGYSMGGNNMVLRPADLHRLRMPEFLSRHGEIGMSRIFRGLNRAYNPSSRQRKVFANLVVHEMGEFTGMVRWLVVVLAMLNEVPVYTDFVHPQGHIRTGLTTKRRFMDYHRVTLRLPKTDPIKYIEKHLRNATRRHRAHEVRAHWRTYLHEQHCSADEHDWTYDHDDGYRLCGKCMAFSRLIHEHVRGDESLGWVRKDYVIKPTVS